MDHMNSSPEWSSIESEEVVDEILMRVVDAEAAEGLALLSRLDEP